MANDMQEHLREMRFCLAQLWQLFSAIHAHADEGTIVHAEQAARALSDHLSSDSVVKSYDQKAAEKGEKPLTELAAEDVEDVEKKTELFFNITDPIRYKDWKPDV